MQKEHKWTDAVQEIPSFDDYFEKESMGIHPFEDKKYKFQLDEERDDITAKELLDR